MIPTIDYHYPTNSYVVSGLDRQQAKTLRDHVAGTRRMRQEFGEFSVPAHLAQTVQIRQLFPDQDLVWTKEAADKFHTVRSDRNVIRNAEQTKPTNFHEYGDEWPHEPFMFQLTAARRMHLAGQALLNDETGLGKTATAILAARYEDYSASLIQDRTLRVLVVCKVPKLYDWWRDFHNWWPSRRPVVVRGTATQRRKMLANTEDYDTYIISYQSLTKHTPYRSWTAKRPGSDTDDLLRHYDIVIIDEAHAICDPTAAQTRAVWTLAQRSRFRFALTATPIRNSYKDLYGIYHFLWPTEFPDYSQYRRRYILSTIGHFGGVEYLGVNTSTFQELYNIVGHRTIRRDYNDPSVTADLPDFPIEPDPTFVEVDLTPKQRVNYDQLIEHLVTITDDDDLIVARTSMHKFQLAQQAAVGALTLDDKDNVTITTPSCKLSWLSKLQESLTGNLLIYVVHVAVGRFLAEHLGGKFIGGADHHPLYYDNLVAEYQQATEPQTLVATFSKFSEGVTLTNTEALVFAEIPTKMIQYKQARGRVRRIGSTLPVDFYILQATNTVDMLRQQIVEGKLSTLLESGKLSSAQMREVLHGYY